MNGRGSYTEKRSVGDVDGDGVAVIATENTHFQTPVFAEPSSNGIYCSLRNIIFISSSLSALLSLVIGGSVWIALSRRCHHPTEFPLSPPYTTEPIHIRSKTSEDEIAESGGPLEINHSGHHKPFADHTTSGNISPKGKELIYEKDFLVVLPNPLEPGDSIKVSGTGGPATLYLWNDDDSEIILTFNPRRGENVVVRNSKFEHIWQHEERGGGYPFISFDGTWDYELIAENSMTIGMIVEGTRFGTFQLRRNHKMSDITKLTINTNHPRQDEPTKTLKISFVPAEVEKASTQGYGQPHDQELISLSINLSLSDSASKNSNPKNDEKSDTKFPSLSPSTSLSARPTERSGCAANGRPSIDAQLEKCSISCYYCKIFDSETYSNPCKGESCYGERYCYNGNLCNCEYDHSCNCEDVAPNSVTCRSMCSYQWGKNWYTACTGQPMTKNGLVQQKT